MTSGTAGKIVDSHTVWLSEWLNEKRYIGCLRSYKTCLTSSNFAPVKSQKQLAALVSHVMSCFLGGFFFFFICMFLIQYGVNFSQLVYINV